MYMKFRRRKRINISLQFSNLVLLEASRYNYLSLELQLYRRHLSETRPMNEF